MFTLKALLGYAQGASVARSLLDLENLFGETSAACDFVDLVQNGFCTRPVAPLQGSFGHRFAASPTVSRLHICSQNRF
jgi:hypothetical protein